jgi:hypothetical protein|tara:strand:- start:33 stop:365 length:333 start_codon:yes stop_codon:yes gene_type:complete
MAFFGENSIHMWVQMDGTGTPAARDSYGLSSISDNGTGDYTFNFSTATANDDYCVLGSNIGATSSYHSAPFAFGTHGIGTGNVRIRTPAMSNLNLFQDTDAIHLCVITDN